MSNTNSQVMMSGMQPGGMVTANTKSMLAMLGSKEVANKFIATLGEEKARYFMQAVRNLILNPANKKIQECDPNSVMRACFACAATNLSLEPSLGQAAIVPYGKSATFMPMKRGLLALAWGNPTIKTINVTEVREGDIKSFNPFTGIYEFNPDNHEGRDQKPIIGYMAYMQKVNGAEKFVYMTVEQCQEHGKRYSKTYGKTNKYDGSWISLWQTNEQAMCEKTVLRKLLLDSGSLKEVADDKLWMALKFDNAILDRDNVLEAQVVYPDNPESKEPIDLTEEEAE